MMRRLIFPGDPKSYRMPANKAINLMNPHRLAGNHLLPVVIAHFRELTTNRFVENYCIRYTLLQCFLL
jgi:hypothetical protein